MKRQIRFTLIELITLKVTLKGLKHEYTADYYKKEFIPIIKKLDKLIEQHDFFYEYKK